VLKHRILTALALIPLVVWGIYALSSEHLAYVLAVFVAIGAWEWTRIIGIRQPVLRAVYVLIVAAMMFVLLDQRHETQILHTILFASAAWWLFALFLIVSYQGQQGMSASALPLNILVGLLLLIPTWLSLVVLHGRDGGAHWLLFMFVLIWVADSGAYFVGRKFGRNKLAPKVSPGKSREGVMGALLFATIYVLLGGMFWLEISSDKMIEFVLMCLVIVLVSVEGDLLESLYKRRAGVKDSGNILPGHGGVLDRIDSVTAAAPLFVLGIQLLEI